MRLLYLALLLSFSLACRAEPAAELFSAAARGRISQVESLLRQGVAVDSRTATRRTPLMIAAYFGNERIVRLLLGYGADVNATDNRGVTPLMEAVAGGWPRVVRWLLASGADVGAKDQSGLTALDRAHQKDHADLVQLLQGDENKDENAADGDTADKDAQTQQKDGTDKKEGDKKQEAAPKADAAKTKAEEKSG
ncbi:conserved hypothetical protein [Methylomarinovum tepidoasis]|uniref:Ankyrin repeat domain-containing protein n=1 Tax=Methylomarinovum tepidoasis TaxID=2840183 RepID=A0AAU9CL08_9GAMM|nr:ankyrin repeat domain-containing protein [Methylomarinovum sp. IN45]BCX88312.1 conserved hypothetical protein [Methylomarinovum sp. IN45]